MSPNKVRILVVDDEEDVRDLMQTVLAAEGYTVELAQDGAEAIERLGEHTYDVILSDMRMPRLGGLELLREVRDHYPRTEVVLVTGYANAETTVETQRMGAFGCLMKPFELADLLAMIQRASPPAT